MPTMVFKCLLQTHVRAVSIHCTGCVDTTDRCSFYRVEYAAVGLGRVSILFYFYECFFLSALSCPWHILCPHLLYREPRRRLKVEQPAEWVYGVAMFGKCQSFGIGRKVVDVYVSFVLCLRAASSTLERFLSC